MTVLHQAPYVTVFDGNGDPVDGAKAYFYDAGTTTPRTVYSDPGLLTAHASPVVADSAGRLPPIYLPSGTYKVRYETSASVLVEEVDNIDPGQSTSAGALAIANGGTGATTAAAARSALGAPSQAAFDALDERVADAEAAIAAPLVLDDETITWTSAITPDYSACNIRRCVLTGTTSINAPTGLVDGQPFILELVQDASGNRSISVNAAFKPPGGAWPTFSTTPNAVDVITGYQKASGDLQVISVKVEDNQNRSAPDVIVLHQTSAGTDGGTSTSGAWQTRALNTLSRNRGSIATLTSSQVTLPAGTYYMEGSGVAYRSQSTQCRIYNVTDSAEVGLGDVVFTEADQNITVKSHVAGVVTISASKAFALQQRVESSRSSDGYGRSASWSACVYASLKIWKLI